MNDGGPAFPCAKFIHGPNGNATVMMGGMSLRDYFAMAALQGLLASWPSAHTSPIKYEVAAAAAYHHADAMLAEREKQTSAAGGKE